MFRSCVRSFSSTARSTDAFFDKVISNLNKPVSAALAGTQSQAQTFRRPAAAGPRAEPSGRRFQNGTAKDNKKPFNRNNKSAKGKKPAGPKVSNKRTRNINPPACEFPGTPFVPDVMDRVQLLQASRSVFGYSPESRLLRAQQEIQQFNTSTMYTAVEKKEQASQIAAEAVAKCVVGELTQVKFNPKAYKSADIALNAQAAALAIDGNVNFPAAIKENLFQVVSGARPVKELADVTAA
ncbi:hypothetical protein BABINDRAFT_123834 [Babjeviella inositovora NRRL Y-12698]|uniref:Uncharacterized protein n=1 Tax=Babjeviella inositovora NRRL Y-12698 TaxID=984486 RepID=A0A1E3QUN6_9ASCO|nr:uncharacterized protein BABINDRAFT_123834 [Babjeviella inositovora NRRL Y-12698]ODQ81378.1 hypothetical protein BABINDRAFT_123834 [Babjeviella inositovora NRRL Y-12698]